MPDTAALVVLGAYARGTGSLQVLELEGSELKVSLEQEKPKPLKCGTFGASGTISVREPYGQVCRATV